MIKPEDPKFSEFIENESKEEYTILVNKLPPGEKIQCSDDEDMSVIKSESGVILNKKCFMKKCFF